MTDDHAPHPIVIAAAGQPGHDYAHLEPIVEAELFWGNRISSNWGRTDKLLDDRTLTLRDPFHVDLVRQTFRLPDSVQMWSMLRRPGDRAPGRLLISDTVAYATISSPLPRGWTSTGRIEW